MFLRKLLHIVLLNCLVFSPAAKAQNPPGNLPSILPATDPDMPVLLEHQSPAEFVADNIFVRVESSKQKVYVGEPFLVTYKFYSSVPCDKRLSKQPEFMGCSISEISGVSDPDYMMMNGKTFQVFNIRKVQVTPLEAGTLQLSSAAVDVIVRVMNRDLRSYQNFSATVSNEPLPITVAALPDTNRPAGFTGVVGDFRVKLSVDSNRVPSGENNVLYVTVEGAGNFGNIRLPDITWPAHTEHFTGNDTQHVNQDNYPVMGSKTFDIPFVHTGTGSVFFEPVKFSFFDPDAQAYRTVMSGGLEVEYTPALAKANYDASVASEDTSNEKYLWIVGAIAVAVVIVVIITSYVQRKKQSKEAASASEKEILKAKQLSEAVAAEQRIALVKQIEGLNNFYDMPDFFMRANSLLIKALELKTGVEGRTQHELIALLRPHTKPELSTLMEEVFATCNRNLYSPIADAGIKEKLYNDLIEIKSALFAGISL